MQVQQQLSLCWSLSSLRCSCQPSVSSRCTGTRHAAVPSTCVYIAAAGRDAAAAAADDDDDVNNYMYSSGSVAEAALFTENFK